MTQEPEKKDIPLDWRAKYYRERAAHELCRQELRRLEQQLASLRPAVETEEERWYEDAPDHWRCDLLGGGCFTLWRRGDEWVYECWANAADVDSESMDEPIALGGAGSRERAEELCELIREEMRLEYETRG